MTDPRKYPGSKIIQSRWVVLHIHIVMQAARGLVGQREVTRMAQAWMLHDWLTVDLNEMLPAADG